MSIPVINYGLTKSSTKAKIESALKSANRVILDKFYGYNNPKKLEDTEMYQVYNRLKQMLT